MKKTNKQAGAMQMTRGEIDQWAEEGGIILTWASADEGGECQCSSAEDADYFGEFLPVDEACEAYSFSLYRPHLNNGGICGKK